MVRTHKSDEVEFVLEDSHQLPNIQSPQNLDSAHPSVQGIDQGLELRFAKHCHPPFLEGVLYAKPAEPHHSSPTPSAPPPSFTILEF